MAPSFLRNAPAWPPFRDAYARLDDDNDQIPLRSKLDPYSARTDSAAPSPYIPTPEIFQTPAVQTPQKRRWQIQGWRGGARVAFYSALSVLIANIVLMIVCTTALKWMDGMTMIYIGSCEQTERINNWVHLAVNVLSTCLLAGSNYCMQLLSAPTRADIDKAHARGHWLDVGVPSLRNLRSLKKQKIALWWILAASSLPLHLFYNSVFFSAIATNDYNVLYATAGFANGTSYDRTIFPDTPDLNVTDVQIRARRFEYLDRPTCISRYATDFVTDRKDVIVVIKETFTNSSLQRVTTNQMPERGFTPDFNAFSWICDDPSTVIKTDGCCNNEFGFIPCARMTTKLEKVSETWWKSAGYNIDYCLSEPIEPRCHEHFAPAIMAPVLLFSIFKTLVIWYVAFRFQDKPLVTLGDAIESFVLHPDPTTKGMCLATPSVISQHWTRGYLPRPTRFSAHRHRWAKSVSRRQWILLTSLFTLITVAVSLSLGYGISTLQPSTLSHAWSLGLGTVRQQNLITGLRIPSLGANAVFISALIANIPQALFSFVYLVYNTIFSTMFLGREWDRFGTHARGRVLRVSDPRENQRSTYFLQVPYRYAIVLLSCSGILHWLVSQSIFLANILILPLNGIVPRQDEITTCAYSPQAMIYLLILGLGMLAWLLGNASRRYSGRMVLVGSCSAAISAACHVSVDDSDRTKSDGEEMVLKAMRWGATDFGNRKSSIFSGSTSTSAASSLTSTPAMGFGFDQQHQQQPLIKELKLLRSPPMTTSSTTTPKQTPKLGTSTKFTERYYNHHDHDHDDDTEISNRRNPSTTNATDQEEERLQIGHCSFSDGMVGKPLEGRFYA